MWSLSLQVDMILRLLRISNIKSNWKLWLKNLGLQTKLYSWLQFRINWEKLCFKEHYACSILLPINILVLFHVKPCTVMYQSSLTTVEDQNNQLVTMAHAGSLLMVELNNGQRKWKLFWTVVRNLIKENKKW